VEGEITGFAPEKVRSVPERVEVLIVPSIVRFPFPEILPSEVIVTPVPAYPPPVVKELSAASPDPLMLQFVSVIAILALAFPKLKLPEYEPVPILTADEPLVLILVVPAIVAPPVAVNSPPRVTLSQSVPVVKVCVAAFRLQYPTVPLVAPVISPLHVRFPFVPSTVQPVCDDPPARLSDVAVLLPGPILIVDPAPNALTVVALLLKRFNVPVAVVPSV